MESNSSNQCAKMENDNICNDLRCNKIQLNKIYLKLEQLESIHSC